MEVEVVGAGQRGGAVWRPLPRGRDRVVRKGEGLKLNGPQIHVERSHICILSAGPR